MARHRTMQPELFTAELAVTSPIPKAMEQEVEQEVRQMMATLLLAVARNQLIAVQRLGVSDEQDHA